MEKNEHDILGDIPSGGKNGKYHSAVLTTYAIDLIHFDSQLLNKLHRKQICSVNVFADYNQMEKSMEYINPVYMKNIGKDYCVTSMNSLGAFHPKINFFVGDESVLVVFGTGNLTVTGHGKNHEAFTGFMIDENDDLHRPLIEECWQYITQFSKQCGDFEQNRILREIPENCSFLSSSFEVEPHKLWPVQEDLDAALLYNEQKSGILQQIANHVPFDDVQRVTVVSPFFDEHGESLVTLSHLCPNANIDVLIQKDCSLPPCEMPYNKQIVFYDFGETKRGKANFSGYDRQLHAKIFHFKTSDSEFCVIGSANATMAGLGTRTKRGINEEFCVLYHSEKKDFLSLLGLKTKKKLNVNVSDMIRSEVGNSSESVREYTISSVQYENGKIIISSNKCTNDDVFVAVDDGINVMHLISKCDENRKLVIEKKLDKKQYTCYLINEDEERVSNIVFINWIEMLETTNPSKTSRSLNRFISRIENEGYEGMDVADILSDIMWDLVNEQNDTTKPLIKTSLGGDRIIDKTLPEIKYNPEYDNDDAKSKRTIVLDRTSRLIECIEESIRRKIRAIETANIDEEEEGTPETGNNRENEIQDEIIISKNRIKDYGDLSNSVLNRYKELIKRRAEQVRDSGERQITKDDLNFFSLSVFSAMEICYLNRPRYQFDELDPMMRSCCQKDLYDSLDRSITNNGLEVLERFVYFCKGMSKPRLDEGFKNVINRSMKYAILYGTLFYKFATANDEQAKGNRIIKAIKTMSSIFGLPTIDYLSQELDPLSERYDYVFRMNHVEKMIKRLAQQ